MKIIVALGNKGAEYAQTRHNFGFLWADFFAKTHNLGLFQEEKRFKGDILRFSWGNEACLLVKPSCFMNKSGESVLSVLQFYKIDPEKELFLVSDDVDLPFGSVRMRKKGGHGGHNGLRNIFLLLGTQNIPRLKLGVQNERKNHMDTADFVLSRFTEDERAHFVPIFKEGERYIEEFL